MSTARPIKFRFFFFNDTATTEIYTLSLHDALPICQVRHGAEVSDLFRRHVERSSSDGPGHRQDRKSTRLNSSHGYISYAVFCLKKKNVRFPPTATTDIQYLNAKCSLTYTAIAVYPD